MSTTINKFSGLTSRVSALQPSWLQTASTNPMSCTNSEKRALDLQNDNKRSKAHVQELCFKLKYLQGLARLKLKKLKKCLYTREDYYDVASFTALRLFTLENLKCLNVWYSPGASIYVYLFFSKWLHTTRPFVTTTYSTVKKAEAVAKSKFLRLRALKVARCRVFIGCKKTHPSHVSPRASPFCTIALDVLHVQTAVGMVSLWESFVWSSGLFPCS